MEVSWSWEQDEELRGLFDKIGPDLSNKKQKWWDDLAASSRTLQGFSGRQLLARWQVVRLLPGLEYKSVSSSPSTCSFNTDAKNTKNVPGKQEFGRAAGRDTRSASSPAAVATSTAAAGRRPVSAAAAVRISATRQSAVGQLRQSALASSHTPLLAFSKTQPSKLPAPSISKQGAPTSPNAVTADDTNETTEGGTSETAVEQGVSGEDDSIVIHVCDENRGINKDFTCRKDVLLSEMAYFRSYLNGSESCEDIDISVHCDIQIFQWLIKYLNEPAAPPSLDTGSVISILISSQFLKMDRLVQLCLDYVCHNLPEILKMPIDLNCLNQDLLTALSARVSVDQLDELVAADRKDKIVSKMYMKKLEALLQADDHQLMRCALCGKLLAVKDRGSLVCGKAKLFIGFHGDVVAEHVPSSAWDINKYLLDLRARKLSWRQVVAENFSARPTLLISLRKPSSDSS